MHPKFYCTNDIYDSFEVNNTTCSCVKTVKRRRKKIFDTTDQITIKMYFSEYNTYNPATTLSYELSKNNKLECHKVSKTRDRNFSSIQTFFRNVFLPEGYPDSVSDDYLSYQLWDTIQAFASSISGSLATQAVLEGVGVGDETATPLAATLTWLMRHGAGMTGQIVFTWFEGSDLDHNCKKWRLFADVLNDSALCLELSGPLWPSWSFQFILCLAGVCRALVGVSGGATRTAITQHQARANNISDVAAKDGSQETMVNLAALFVNLAILPILSGDLYWTWGLFLLLTALHLYANYRAVKTLNFDTLNEARLLHVLHHFSEFGDIPSPRTVNGKESVFLGCGPNAVTFCGAKINLGASLSSICSRLESTESLLNLLGKRVDDEPFMAVEMNGGKQFDVLIFENYEPDDLLRAYIDTFWTAYRHNYHQKVNKEFKTKTSYANFENVLSKVGWKTTHLQMNTLGWVGTFKKSL